jgi:hypothetical protein
MVGYRAALALILGAAVAACATSPGLSPTAAGTPAPSLPANSSAGAAAGTSAPDCDITNPTLLHGAPELEALLPVSVAGRSLARWSVRGRCWVKLTVNRSPSEVDELLAQYETPNDPRRIDLATLSYGVAGRSDTKADPPFFVFGAARPQDQDEVRVALDLMFGSVGFHDLGKLEDLTANFQERTMGGKRVYVGTVDMLNQDEHQRGRPFLYQTDDYMFLVITDDDGWAADAIGQLP